MQNSIAPHGWQVDQAPSTLTVNKNTDPTLAWIDAFALTLPSERTLELDAYSEFAARNAGLWLHQLSAVGFPTGGSYSPCVLASRKCRHKAETDIVCQRRSSNSTFVFYTRPMTLWNIYFFEHGKSGLVRKLIYRGLKASSEKSAIDIVCKQLKDNVQRGALFAREAKADDWCAPPRAS